MISCSPPARGQPIIHFARRAIVNQSGDGKIMVAESIQKVKSQLEYTIGKNVSLGGSCGGLQLSRLGTLGITGGSRRNIYASAT